MIKDSLKCFTKSFIENEIKAVKSLLFSWRSFEKAIILCTNIPGKIVFTGVGKSGAIGVKLASTFNSMGILATFLHATEAMHGDFGAMRKGDLLIALSASGETKEVHRVASYAKKNGMPIIAITSNVKSSLAKLSSQTISFKIKKEGSPFNLAPMASATASLVAGDMLAAILATKKGFNKKDFSEFHPGGFLGLEVTSVSEMMICDNLPLVKFSDPLMKAFSEINSKKKGVVGVLDSKNKLVGVISDGDIRRCIASGKFSYNLSVSKIVKKNPKTILERASLNDALQTMEFYKITSLFVVDDDRKLKGLIHMHQIVESKVL